MSATVRPLIVEEFLTIVAGLGAVVALPEINVEIPYPAICG